MTHYVGDAITMVRESQSWFRDTLHYWAQGSLPLAYAVVSVDVVSKRSEKAGILYSKIVERWSEPCDSHLLNLQGGKELKPERNQIYRLALKTRLENHTIHHEVK